MACPVLGGGRNAVAVDVEIGQAKSRGRPGLIRASSAFITIARFHIGRGVIPFSGAAQPVVSLPIYEIEAWTNSWSAAVRRRSND